jgi:hypothetical protein
MHRNENKYDQMFRDRLRDLTHPVRNDLWSRIQSGIRFRNPSVPNPGTKPSLPGLAARLNGLFSATSLTVAAAALAITLGIIHFTHTATKPSAQPVNHYSTITPAKAPARSTGESSVTPRDSSRDSAVPTPSSTASSSNGLSGVPDVTGIPGTAITSANSTPENAATTTRRHHISTAPGAHGMFAAPETTSRTTETMPGTHGMEGATATPGRQTPGIQTPVNQTMGKLSLDHHNPSLVTLPALARTSNRVPIAAGSPGSKYRYNGSNDPGKWPAPPPFKRTGYLSLYASPDFPNHNYTWSYTLGGRLTFQFSRRWSFTSGFEYARVNVPTQNVPGNSALQAFHFSNYEVPVLFGYTRASRHAALTVYGGAIINLYFHASTGAYIDNLPDRDSYGAVLGVEYSYSLGRHLDVFAQPYARYSISDYRMFTQTQRWSFGTLLGIKFKL